MFNLYLPAWLYRALPFLYSGIDTMIESIAASIAKQIAEGVYAKLAKELAQPVAQPRLTFTIPPEPEAPLMDKPRIGIVGLLPQQQECINREFGDTFELRYWKDESTSALKALGRSCELVFITKWAGHSISETLTSVGATWRMVHGGLSDLKDALTALYVEEH